MQDCTRCGKEIEPIEAFPGGLCVGCYENEFDEAERGKSAEQKALELRQAFSSKAVRI